MASKNTRKTALFRRDPRPCLQAYILALCLSLQSPLFAANDPVLHKIPEPENPTIEYNAEGPHKPDQVDIEENIRMSYPLTPAGSDIEILPHFNHPKGNMFFVSPSGSDDSAGTQAKPWKTMQHAVNQLEPGDALYILPGQYHEPVKLTTSGNERAWISIEGVGTVLIDHARKDDQDTSPKAAFDTNAQAFVRITNFTVANSQAAVEVNGGRYIEIDTLKSTENNFAVKIDNANNIKVRNVYASNNQNAFRTEGRETRLLLFENIEASGSKELSSENASQPDDFSRESGGFIFKDGKNITLRNVASSNSPGAGFDIQANNVTLENILAFGNRSNLSSWGENVVVKNALIFGAQKESQDGSPDEWAGNGINARKGTLKIIRSTIANNRGFNLKMGEDAAVMMEKSIVFQDAKHGELVENDRAYFRHEQNVWYASDGFQPTAGTFLLSLNESWIPPGFEDVSAKNFRLSQMSLAKGFGYDGVVENLLLARESAASKPRIVIAGPVAAAAEQRFSKNQDAEERDKNNSKYFKSTVAAVTGLSSEISSQ